MRPHERSLLAFVAAVPIWQAQRWQCVECMEKLRWMGTGTTMALGKHWLVQRDQSWKAVWRSWRQTVKRAFYLHNFCCPCLSPSPQRLLFPFSVLHPRSFQNSYLCFPWLFISAINKGSNKIIHTKVPVASTQSHCTGRHRREAEKRKWACRRGRPQNKTEAR